MNVKLSPIYNVICGIENKYANAIVSTRDDLTCVLFTSFKIRGHNSLLAGMDTCEWYEALKIGVFRNSIDVVFVKVSPSGDVTELDTDDAELENLFVQCPSIYEKNPIRNSIDFVSSIPSDSRSTTPDSMFAYVQTPSPKKRRYD